jgi:hypothetical protein
MIPATQLTIIRNLHRSRELREFRKWVEVYFERSDRDPDDIIFDAEGARNARSQINRMLPRILGIVRAAGIGGTPLRDSNTDPGQIFGRMEVLHRIFTARPGDGLDQQVYDLLDMAIGVYDGDRPVALVRSINPLYYAGRILSWFGRGPRRLFSALGLGRRQTLDDARLARLEEVAARLAETEDLIDQRFAALQDHQALQRAGQANQLAELAERIDFVERVIAAPKHKGYLDAPRDQDHTTPV